jgi:hypothetical protein
VGRVSVIEFGVAGGNGLVAMEKISERVEQQFGIRIDIYGFDTGVGLPRVADYRDVPNVASIGWYVMDQAKLRGRLRGSQLILGDIKDTIVEFMASKPAPIAFLACDLVLYTSTRSALRVLDADERMLLPRFHCNLDDVFGFAYGDYNGERLAIHEFNTTRPMRKVSSICGSRHYVPAGRFNDMWVEKCWITYIFDHSMYAKGDNLVKQHKRRLQEVFGHSDCVASIGRQLPILSSQVALDPTKKDSLGLPVPYLINEPRANDLAVMKAMSASLKAILETAGATTILGNEQEPGMSSHYIGTCRMGLDPRDSVVDPWSCTHDVPDFFIADGSVFVTGGSVNPVLAISALATRTAEGIVRAFT